MAIEAPHFGNAEHADAAEGAGAHVQHLALGDIGAQIALAVALQAVEGDGAGRNIALQRAAGKVRLAARGLQQAVLDQLILDGAVAAQLALGGIAAMEAHKGIGELAVIPALDVLVIDIPGHAVVDVQQRHGVAGNARADILAQRAIDVHLAGDRNAPAGQAAVDIAGFKAELLGECRPALVGKAFLYSNRLFICSFILFSFKKFLILFVKSSLY